MRIRHAQVGLGVRSWRFSIALVNRWPERHELVALCDSNPGRLEQRQDWGRANGLELPGHAPDRFERMIAETRPDVVIVTTPDVAHDRHAVQAMGSAATCSLRVAELVPELRPGS